MKDDHHTGCGIYPVLLKNTRFYDACGFHDSAYVKDSWHQKNMSREALDDWFYAQMLLAAGNSRWHQFRAKMFAKIASTFGGMFWEGAWQTEAGKKIAEKVGKLEAVAKSKIKRPGDA